MKKSKKSKTSKPSTRKAAKASSELPSLVVVMTKLVERFEGLEKKIDLVLSRIPAGGLAAKETSQVFRPQHANGPDQGQKPGRTLYDAICADCCKNCRVPFRPSGDRPVYCPECFAIRKAGHKPKDPNDFKSTSNSQKPPKILPDTRIETLPPAESTVFHAKGRSSKKKTRKAGKKRKK